MGAQFSSRIGQFPNPSEWGVNASVDSFVKLTDRWTHVATILGHRLLQLHNLKSATLYMVTRCQRSQTWDDQRATIPRWMVEMPNSAAWHRNNVKKSHLTSTQARNLFQERIQAPSRMEHIQICVPSTEHSNKKHECQLPLRKHITRMCTPTIFGSTNCNELTHLSPNVWPFKSSNLYF